MAETDKAPVCENCRFHLDGHCRRYAPPPTSVLRRLTEFRAEAASADAGTWWPATANDDWCGEHEFAPAATPGTK